MPATLSNADANFDAALRAFLARRGEGQPDVAETVSAILARVKAEGDAALLDYTRRFDHAVYSSESLRVAPKEIRRACDACAPELRKALELAAARILAYHEKQMPEDMRYTDETGITLGWRWTAVDAAGIYVPGGLAVYPSSVLMNALPAKAAGVRRIVMTAPTPEGVLNPALLAAAAIAGVDEIYKVGGAQAIAALAYGTESIAPVDVIAGPGNAYVAEAKRQVFGTVGIDMVAGPSEILVVADAANDPRWIAADLLSQAEHAPDAQAILITDSGPFARRVTEEIETLLNTLPRGEVARRSWQEQGAVILVESLEQAPAIIDRIAPEHLELAMEEPERLAEKVRHAGAIFLGRATPEAIGDYIAGPSHVLPTSHTARFSSGLSALNFLKRTSFIGCAPKTPHTLYAAAETLAQAEGLPAHALSLRLRREG